MTGSSTAARWRRAEGHDPIVQVDESDAYWLAPGSRSRTSIATSPTA